MLEPSCPTPAFLPPRVRAWLHPLARRAFLHSIRPHAQSGLTPSGLAPFGPDTIGPYAVRSTIRPRPRSTGESSSRTVSPTSTRMKLRSARSAMCAVTICPRSSLTRYNPLGSCSVTTPCTSVIRSAPAVSRVHAIAAWPRPRRSTEPEIPSPRRPPAATGPPRRSAPSATTLPLPARRAR